jgi:predicted transcriptional regulator
LRQRLHLTPEQETLVAPVLRAELDKRSEIRKRYQYSDPREAMPRMAREERQVREETLTRLAEILSPTQLDVLRRLQEEGVRGPDGPAGRGGGGPGRGKGPGMVN